MYEELVKRLSDAAKISEALAVLLPHSEGNATAKLYKEAADAIEELSRLHEAQRQNLITLMNEDPEMQWIPVTERLPDAFKHVLVNIPGMTPHPTVQEAFLEKNGMWYSNGFRYSAEEITHWMRLPEPPKGET